MFCSLPTGVERGVGLNEDAGRPPGRRRCARKHIRSGANHSVSHFIFLHRHSFIYLYVGYIGC